MAFLFFFGRHVQSVATVCIYFYVDREWSCHGAIVMEKYWKIRDEHHTDGQLNIKFAILNFNYPSASNFSEMFTARR